MCERAPTGIMRILKAVVGKLVQVAQNAPIFGKRFALVSFGGSFGGAQNRMNENLLTLQYPKTKIKIYCF